MRKRKGFAAALALSAVLFSGAMPLTAYAVSPNSGGTIIPDEEVPLAASPSAEGIVIEDSGVPLGALTTIDDGAVPLTGLPKTGDTSSTLPWILMCAGSGAVVLTIGLDSTRKRRESGRE